MSGCGSRAWLATIDVVKRGDLTGEVLDGRYRVAERVGRGTAKNHPNPIVRARATAELRRYK